MTKKTHHEQEKNYELLLNKASKLFAENVFKNAHISMTEQQKEAACKELLEAIQQEAEKLNFANKE